MLLVPAPFNSFKARVKLLDDKDRRLNLDALVQMRKGAGIRISVLAPYWIINKTSLPLVFKQEGASAESAGQFDENEVARVVSPLLFSLSDPDAGPTIQARIGNGCHKDGSPTVSD